MHLKNYLLSKVIRSGSLDVEQRYTLNLNIPLKPLTNKDIAAISMAQKHGIKYYAMSFVNKGSDVDELRKIRLDDFIISKIETKNSLGNLSKIMQKSNALLIDRGDLSRYISIDKIPIIQEAISRKANKKNKTIICSH